jgi:hypothetical protein
MSGASRIDQSVKLSYWPLLVALLILGLSAPGYASENLLHNGNLSIGAGDSVDGWRTEAWVEDAGSTDYHWIPPAGGQPGQVELFSHRDNDARWQQPLTLPEGWYYLSAEARTHDVQTFRTGANVSVLDGGIASADIKGNTDWQKLGFYLKISKGGADVDFCLRLGGFGNLTRGQAFFRDARIARVAEPPPGAEHVFDLEEVRKAQVSAPIGQPWSMVVTFFVLVALAAVGWRLMSEPASRRAARSPVASEPPLPNRKKRARAR